MPTMPMIERRHVTSLVGAGALVVGLVVGAEAVGQDENALENAERLIQEKELAPIIIQPPAIAVPKDGFAIVGAEDGRYYIIRDDATTEIVYPDRRGDLLWRPLP